MLYTLPALIDPTHEFGQLIRVSFFKAFMKFLYSIISIFSLFAVSLQGQSEETTIYVYGVNSSDQPIYAYPAGTTLLNSSYILPIDSVGYSTEEKRGELQISSSQSRQIILVQNKEKISPAILLEPGDTIRLFYGKDLSHIPHIDSCHGAGCTVNEFSCNSKDFIDSVTREAFLSTEETSFQDKFFSAFMLKREIIESLKSGTCRQTLRTVEPSPAQIQHLNYTIAYRQLNLLSDSFNSIKHHEEFLRIVFDSLNTHYPVPLIEDRIRFTQKLAYLINGVVQIEASESTPAADLQRTAAIVDEYTTGLDNEYAKYWLLEIAMQSYSASDNDLLRVCDSLVQELNHHADDKYLAAHLATRLERKRALAPDGQACEVAGTDPDNQRVSLSDFKGSYILLDIWASWCAPCVSDIPVLQSLQDSLRNENITFLSAGAFMDREAWLSFIERHDMAGNQIFVEGEDAVQALECFLVFSLPRYIFIGPDGRIIDEKVEDIEELLPSFFNRR